MPIYLYKNPETKEIIEVVQSMNEPHKYIDEKGTEWDRVWINPNTSIDSSIDPFSEKDFLAKTASQKGTLGDLWDQSRELSEKRAKMSGGKDPIKEKYLKGYKRKRKGMKHKDDK